MAAASHCRDDSLDATIDMRLAGIAGGDIGEWGILHVGVPARQKDREHLQKYLVLGKLFCWNFAEYALFFYINIHLRDRNGALAWRILVQSHTEYNRHHPPSYPNISER